MARSIPLAECGDDVLTVLAQNGEALRPEQSDTPRLVVPGWAVSTRPGRGLAAIGVTNTSTRTLRRIMGEAVAKRVEFDEAYAKASS